MVEGQRNLPRSPLQGTQALEAVEGCLMTGSITREVGGTNLNPPIQPVAGCSSTEADARRNVNIILCTMLADGFLFISRSDHSWKISVDTYQFDDICTWPEMKEILPGTPIVDIGIECKMNLTQAIFSDGDDILQG